MENREAPRPVDILTSSFGMCAENTYDLRLVLMPSIPSTRIHVWTARSPALITLLLVSEENRACVQVSLTSDVVRIQHVVQPCNNFS